MSLTTHHINHTVLGFPILARVPAQNFSKFEFIHGWAQGGKGTTTHHINHTVLGFPILARVPAQNFSKFEFIPPSQSLKFYHLQTGCHLDNHPSMAMKLLHRCIGSHARVHMHFCGEYACIQRCCVNQACAGVYVR